MNLTVRLRRYIPERRPKTSAPDDDRSHASVQHPVHDATSAPARTLDRAVTRVVVTALAAVTLLDAVGLAFGHLLRRWRRQQPRRGATTDTS